MVLCVCFFCWLIFLSYIYRMCALKLKLFWLHQNKCVWRLTFDSRCWLISKFVAFNTVFSFIAFSLLVSSSLNHILDSFGRWFCASKNVYSKMLANLPPAPSPHLAFNSSFRLFLCQAESYTCFIDDNVLFWLCVIVYTIFLWLKYTCIACIALLFHLKIRQFRADSYALLVRYFFFWFWLLGSFSHSPANDG